MAHLPTILIVDDDPSIRKMLVEVLQLEGYPTETANNGREAMDLLAHSGPRIILLDLQMPILDGLGVLDEMSAIPGEREKHKVIIVSAYLHLDKYADVEADGKLQKPFTVPQLLNVLAPVSVAR